MVEVCWETLPAIFVRGCIVLRPGLERLARHVLENSRVEIVVRAMYKRAS